MQLLISTEVNSHFSVAVGAGEEITRIKTVKKQYQQSEQLLKEIDRLIKHEVLTGIIVVKGPGDFSALRIGISSANALAFGWGIPVVGLKLTAKEKSLEELEKLQSLWKRGVKALGKAKPNVFIKPEYDHAPNITLKKNN